MTDCWLIVDGARFADTAPDLEGGTPTALADVEVAWGRGTTVDQPDAATARAVVLDRSGGSRFVDTIPVGVPFDVWTSGDVSTGAPAETVTDGGWETMAPGPAGVRVKVDPSGTATVVTTGPHAGAHALRVAAAAGTTTVGVWVPPQAFDTVNPSAWDDVPQAEPGTVWQFSAWVRAPRGTIRTHYAYFDDPAGTAMTAAGSVSSPGDATWQHATGSVYVAATYPTQWLGVYVRAPVPAWADLTGDTWQSAPGAWADYAAVDVDDVSVLTPADALFRDVLVFSGRVTDLSATRDRDGTARVEVTAVDQLADLQNRTVGDEPWATETLAARATRIVDLSGAAVDLLIDDPLGALVVTRRDVDSQPAGGLLAELAQGVDGVLWSATHATTGPYLWLENPVRRATLGVLVEGVDGIVRIQPDTSTNAPAGRTVLDGGTLPQGEVTWARDVTDVLTRVDATWQEQTTPDLTERNVRAVDTAAEADYGARRMSVSTPLTTATDASDVCNRILGRSRAPQWRTEGLTWDAGLIPPARGEQTAALLDVLDGTIRLGRGLVVSNVAEWPGGTAAAYLDGGRYRYEGAWVLQFVTTPWGGVATSGPWNSLDPAWAWNEFDPEMNWAALYGVAGPVVELEGVS